jgi:hypothetical protein
VTGVGYHHGVSRPRAPRGLVTRAAWTALGLALAWSCTLRGDDYLHRDAATTAGPGEGGAGGDGPTTSAGGGGAGGGGAGGGGAGGGEPEWGPVCAATCIKIEGCSTIEDFCVSFMIDCEGAPPPEPLECIMRCFADPDATCAEDFDPWMTQAEKPLAPSEFASCVSACPGDPLNVSAPTWGVLEDCMPFFCATQSTDCNAEQDCEDWYVDCSLRCFDPACWQTCTAAHPSLTGPAMVQCLCDVQQNHPNEGPPATAWTGTVDCSDLLAGFMDACNL